MKILFDNIPLPSNRKFGFFFTIIFFTISIYLYIKKFDIFFIYTFGVIAISFFIITLIKADILISLNRLWMSLGILLSLIVSPIVMGIIFFFIFTPIAIIIRIIGRDELILRIKNKSSYWIKRDDNNHSNSFRHQF